MFRKPLMSEPCRADGTPFRGKINRRLTLVFGSFFLLVLLGAAAAMNPKPTNLADKAAMSKLDDVALTNAIVKGGAANGKSPLMPGFTQLKDQEVKDLVAYIRSIAK